ncbi:hypothetical protein LCGC14_2924990 [marine sediment metagenome]|uniref:Uncharacterized protein n=1 Tax=marine sediment metagenome TaxID=412755 RepID=A0A0F8XMR5_9ZZZZ
MIAITKGDAEQVVAMLRDLAPLIQEASLTNDNSPAVCAMADLLQELVAKEDHCVRR